MNSIVFQDINVARYLFSTISRLYDKVHFDIKEDSMRLISIDPHDFCYMNLFMTKQFFRKYDIEKPTSFAIPIDKLRTILPKISDATQIELTLDKTSLNFVATKDWKMIFSIDFLKNDPFNLPEPKEISYESNVVLKAPDFSKLVEGASTVSDEIIFSLKGKQFTIRSEKGGHEFTGHPSQILEINNDKEILQAQVITKYLSHISPLIKRCDRVKINIGNNKPVKFDILYRDKASFSFILSQKVPKTIKIKTSPLNLPVLSSTKLPEYLRSLEENQDGRSVRSLIAYGLETSDELYFKYLNSLGLIIKIEDKISLSNEGKLFINKMKGDIKHSKNYIHELSMERNITYNIMYKHLKEYPHTQEELLNIINKNLVDEKINTNYMNLLLGIGIWAGIIDKKLALYYFDK